METGVNAFKEALHLKHVEAGEYSPLALAYIGDAVYELAIRTLVMNRGNMHHPARLWEVLVKFTLCYAAHFTFFVE